MSNASAHSIISDTRRFVARDGLVSRRIGDETILVPVTSRVGDLDAIYTLTDVGSHVWAMLRQPVSLDQMVDGVCGEYDVPADVARQDIVEFVDVLVSAHLVRVDQGS